MPGKLPDTIKTGTDGLRLYCAGRTALRGRTGDWRSWRMTAFL